MQRVTPSANCACCSHRGRLLRLLQAATSNLTHARGPAADFKVKFLLGGYCIKLPPLACRTAPTHYIASYPIGSPLVKKTHVALKKRFNTRIVAVAVSHLTGGGLCARGSPRTRRMCHTVYVRTSKNVIVVYIMCICTSTEVAQDRSRGARAQPSAGGTI